VAKLTFVTYKNSFLASLVSIVGSIMTLPALAAFFSKEWVMFGLFMVAGIGLGLLGR